MLMDPKTGLIIATLLMVANGVVLGVMHRGLSPDVQPSAADWRIATLLAAGGSLLLAMQTLYPLWFVLPPANFCLALAVCLYWRAIRRYQGVADNIWIFLPVPLCVIAITYFTIVEPSVKWRVIVSCATWFVPLVACARLLVTHDREYRERAQFGLSVVFIGVAAFMLIRAIYFGVVEGAATSILDVHNRMNQITPIVMTILPVIGTTVFLLMCSERIRRQWEVAAATDYLTQLPNRRTITASAESRFAASRRSAAPFSVAVIDIDHFKSVNDRYGHEVGDMALTHVAQILDRMSRGKHMVGRFGGEEFVALFENANEAAALAAAERMRESVANTPLVVAAQTLNFTVSVGVATLRVDDPRVDDLLRRADGALYQAKEAGRNRTLAAR
jgi:diguanylate cyclase (GGDEF)-like protein